MGSLKLLDYSLIILQLNLNVFDDCKILDTFSFSPLLEILHWKKLADVNMARWIVCDGQPQKNNAGQPHQNMRVFLAEDINIFMELTDLKALVTRQPRKLNFKLTS